MALSQEGRYTYENAKGEAAFKARQAPKPEPEPETVPEPEQKAKPKGFAAAKAAG